MRQDKQDTLEMHTASGELDERILVLAAGGRNGTVLCHILQAAELSYQLCPSMAALISEASRGAGVVLLTAQMLTTAALTQLQAMLDQQPHWSELPLVLLVERKEMGLLSQWQVGAHVTLLQQPVRRFTLVSILQAALRARQWQYEVRNLHASLEERVQARTEQVQKLATELTLSEQGERRRIAQILHDDLQQRLYSVNFQLSTVRSALASQDPETVELTLAEIEAAMGNAIEITRNLSVDLSPPVLYSKGLEEAIIWLGSQMEQQHGLVVTVQVVEPLPMPGEDLRVLLFQGVRELLFNVVKHAGVAKAVVALAYEEGQIRIEVSDQGLGFDTDTHSAHTSQGLMRIAQRLQFMGGDMQIRSCPGKGTCVTLYTPLGAKQDQ
jgi:signal transduction histidine kinase